MFKILIILLCFAFYNSNAQQLQADKKFNLYQYSDAIPLYIEYLENNPGNYDASLNLALCYKYLNDVDNAIASYKNVIGLPEAVPQDCFELIQLLRIKGNLSEAKDYTLQLQKKENSSRVDNLVQAIDNYPKFMAAQNDYVITNKTINYAQSVFGGVLYRNGLIVTAESNASSKSTWTGQGYTKLFVTDLDCSELKPFASEIMSDFNDGPASFSIDGNTIYFTTPNEELLKEKDVNTRKLQISSASSMNGKWIKADVFPFNNSSYNVAYPALSTDGKMLIFCSDKPGGFGGIDLYYSIYKDDQTWSEPVNITSLNTSGNERFPSFDNNGNFFFASDGHPGLGGLDLFSSKINGSTFTVPINLNAPINSSYDDFSLSTDDNLVSGFASSNRFGDSQSDDIFYFKRKVEELPVILEKTTINILVIDKYTAIPLPYVSVSVKDTKNNTVYKGLSDPQGNINVEDIGAGDYEVQGMLNDITTTIAKISISEFSKPLIEKTVTHNDPRFTLSGIVINADNGEPVPEVTVYCTNSTLKNKNSIVTTDDGKFFFQLEQTSDFIVEGKKEGFFTNSAGATTRGLDRSEDLYVNLELKVAKIEIGKEIVLENIYYDLDKSNIRNDAATELNKLVKILVDNPNITIELGSHTDSRGSDDYNLKLSQRRAESAVAYIISKGIEKKRIYAKGYGETKLTNKCENDITCPEEEHQKNRRTEFKVVSIN